MLARIGRLRTLSLWQPLALRDFRLVWLGQSISLLGDQFHFVALTWLTLQLTGSGLALGTVLMAASIPRAVFMLVGGAMSDRASPRRLMLVSNVLRALLVAAITVLVFLEAIRLWHIYVLAMLFGLVDAFFYPALATIVPALVDEERLPAGNALVRGTAQLTVLLGPAPAGVLIAASGTAWAFAVDAASFAFAALTLVPVRDGRRLAVAPAKGALDGAAKPDGLLSTIGEGLRYAASEPIVRAIVLMVAAIDFSFIGPFNVGLAALADRRFGGAAAFGAMLSAWGAAALAGTVVAGSLPRLRHRGIVVVSTVGAMGLCLALLGIAPSVLAAAALIAAMGVGGGFINVVVVAWLQTSTDSRMLGRVMSLVMLASQGMAPLSYAIAGAFVDLHAAIMFAAAGGIVLLATAASLASRTVRRFD